MRPRDAVRFVIDRFRDDPVGFLESALRAGPDLDHALRQTGLCGPN